MLKRKIIINTSIISVIMIMVLNACGGAGSSNKSSDTTPPEIKSTTPANGAANLPRNSSISITFNEEMDIDSVTNSGNFQIDDGFSIIAGTTTYHNQSFTATFTPASVLGNHQIYTATVTTGMTDKKGNSLESDYSWTFTTIEEDETSPIISAGSGNPTGTDIGQEAAITIELIETQSMLDLSTFNSNTNFVVEIDGSGEPISGNFSQERIDSETVRVSFTPDELLKDTTEYSVTIGNSGTDIIKDASGNPLGNADTAAWTFTVAAQPPVIISHFPGIDAINISRDANISIIFNEPMDDSTVENGNYFTINDGSSDITGTRTYYPDTKTITFDPDSILDNKQLYTVTLTIDIKDANNVNLAAEYTWSFTTSDTVGPDVISFTPSPDGVEGIARDTNITIIFNEQIDEATIGISSIIIKDDQNSIVFGVYSYDNSTNTVTFNPNSDLKTFTVYTVEITTDITDLNDNNMQSPVSWSFKTAKKTCRISWNVNRESAVNRAGGGYRVYYSGSAGFNITDPGVIQYNVPWVSGDMAPSFIDLELERGYNYFRVVAYSSLNGVSASQPSAQGSITVE